jgi:biopolymer transport protein ExbB/TolQ
VLAILNSWPTAVAACVLITAVFVIAWLQLRQRLQFVEIRNRQLHALLFDAGGSRPPADYWIAKEVHKQIAAIENERSSGRRAAMLRDVEVEAARLEGSVAFWVDLLRQLGLLGTVLGLGLSLLAQDTSVRGLLAPLGLAVWTTVVGLVWSIAISWRFGREVVVHADETERNVEAWRAKLGRQSSQSDKAS